MADIHEVFDIEPVPQRDPIVADVPKATDENFEDVDFEAARNNVYDILEQYKAAINTGMHVAAESQNPRALEVLGTLLKQAAETNKQLVQMSKDKQDVKSVKKQNQGGAGPQQPQIGTQQNITFVGTSADLNAMLSKKLNELSTK